MLPEGWKVKYSKTHNNRPYYFNEVTGVTQWDPPSSSANDYTNNTTTTATNKVHVYHLLIKHAGSRRPSSWRQEVITCSESEALEEIKSIRSQIYASELGIFEAFKHKAGERSDCSSAKRSGDLGFFGPGEMQSKWRELYKTKFIYQHTLFLCLESFEDASFALKVNELSGPIKSDSGVHLIYRVK